GFKGILVDEEENARKFMDKTDAEAALKSINEKGHVILYETQEKSVKAPLLYNLAKLQQDMGRKYSFSPDKTLEIAQALYEKYKMISYPRTDSQYLSMDIYDEIAEHIKSCRFGSFAKLIDKIDFSGIKADKSYFNDLKVTDHHAFIPTINDEMEERYNSLKEDERKVFDTIILSLIAIFYPDYCYEATKIIVEVGGKHFKSTGTTIKQLGFKTLFHEEEKSDENSNDLQILPKMCNGDEITVDSSKIIERKTLPPKKYNDETIIKVMEQYNIGTSATRAEIIKKLQNPKRQFLARENGKYSATDLGKEYIRIVPDELKSPELTQQFEDNLQKVNAGTLSKDDFLEKLLQDIRENIVKFTSHPIPDEQKIGYTAVKAREDSNLGKCPKCGSIVKSGQYGAYCSGRCGMTVSRIRGKTITDEQVTALLKKQKVYITELKKREGGNYSAFFVPIGIEPYSYTTNDGTQKQGYQFKFQVEFKKKNFRK
ncbi:MAG: DNA topoisomerase, partial [Eubacterium sp.]|nr:DNA topoisomerase [Eubacterium sp.]